jgi:hypothetical protein
MTGRFVVFYSKQQTPVYGTRVIISNCLFGVKTDISDPYCSLELSSLSTHGGTSKIHLGLWKER